MEPFQDSWFGSNIFVCPPKHPMIKAIIDYAVDKWYADGYVDKPPGIFEDR